MSPKLIDLNSADAKELTQLPGVAINLAHDIVTFRTRRGYFTTWEELGQVKGFPMDKLEDIKQRAAIGHPEGVEHMTPPRHMQAGHIEGLAKKTGSYTKAMRTGRRSEKMNESRHRKAS